VRTIRPAILDDAGRLFVIAEACLRDGRCAVELAGVSDSLRYAAHVDAHVGAPDHGFFVADEGGVVVGQVLVRRHRPSFVRHVAALAIEVDPGAQRRGHGRALLEHAIGWAREVGLLRLELTVRADNVRALALYAACGFREESRRPRYVRLPDGTFVDDLVWVLSP
jgi:ribosomal protein S18 acetylase RimI-like enzyme